MQTRLQYGFSALHPKAVFDLEGRKQKAQKVLCVLADHLGAHVLDVRCAAGIGTSVYAAAFSKATGFNIDLPAVLRAKQENTKSNLSYLVADCQKTPFAAASFDVIVCSHVYEHVPSARALMEEVFRLLKPGGVCYFAAGNRISLMEPHYRLPLLSAIPKAIAHLYLRCFRRGDRYYETHSTYWSLRRLVSRFRLIDYTLAVVKHPARFHADDSLVSGSIKQKTALAILRVAYWLCPTYIWLLVKV